ncbi:MAG TPA: cupredoxin domain-containing protein [Anaerolineales bacterium]|nr:cupredoxin domain-containing protein [Anaerolineales bacterium]
MTNVPKPGTPSRNLKIAVAVVVGLVLIGASLFIIVQRNATSLGGGPGLFGTRAGLFADLNLLAEIILLLGLMVGFAFARIGGAQPNKENREAWISAHQYNQTSWVLFNLILVIFIMALVFARQVVPGIPDNLRGAYGATSTLHAALGILTILCGLYLLLRMNRLLPRPLRISWWKNLMRFTLAMYWVVGLFGLGTYYVWYIRPLPAVVVPTPEATQVAGQVGGKVVVPLANYAFVPVELTLPAGTTIVFQNVDPDAHTVTFDNNEFPAIGLQGGDTREVLFDKVGDFQFYCEYHGSPGRKGMSGVIHVVPAGQLAAVPTSAPPPTATPPPTPVPFDELVLSVNGAGIFRDATAHNDSFQLVLSGVPSGLSGDLRVWLTGAGSALDLGATTVDAEGKGEFHYIDAHGINLLGDYSGFLVTVEAAGSEPTAPSSQVVFGGRIPGGVLGPVHQLLVASDAAPEHRAYAWQLIDQAEEITHHATELNRAAQTGDRESMNRHIEHMVAIVNGKSSPETVDFDGDGFVDNPGDGFGILNYADAIEAQAKAAAAAPDATENVQTQAQELQALAGNIRAWAKRMLELGLGAHNAQTDADRQAHTQDIPGLAAQLLNGVDADGNGLIEPVEGEGGAFTIYFSSQQMAAMGALTEADLSGLPTPEPPTATPPPGATPAPTATVGPTATPGPVTVVFRNFEIVPNELTIPAGTKVIFVIKDSQHEVYQSFPDSTDIAGFDSGPLNPGQQYILTFTNPGTYTIRCGFHPNKMVMTLTVTP